MASPLGAISHVRTDFGPAKPSKGDCPAEPTMASVDHALDLILTEVAPRAAEHVRLEQAGGRILARPIVAQRTAPTCDVSAMDGYAVRDADLTAERNVLTVSGESFAGHGFGRTLDARCAVRIFTGAPVPPGADRVVLQEDVRRLGDRVVVPAICCEKRHIRRAAADFAGGDVLVGANLQLTPARLVAAAAADVAEVAVYPRPRIRIVTTGDELRLPGTGAAGPDTIPESVSFGVVELARLYGGDVTVERPLRDDLAQLQSAAARMLADTDIIVIIGGASVGERDFSRRMFERAGLDTRFSKVSIRPGKPVWYAMAGRTRILGLPGNPTAAMFAARLFLAPLVAAMAGREPRTVLAWRSGRLANGIEANGEFERFLGARSTADGIMAFANRDSSAQRTLGEVDVLIRQRPHAPATGPGELVDILEF